MRVTCCLKCLNRCKCKKSKKNKRTKHVIILSEIHQSLQLACKIFWMVGMTNVFTACAVKHFINSLTSKDAHSASASLKESNTSGRQKGAHISAANVPIALRAPCLAKLAA